MIRTILTLFTVIYSFAEGVPVSPDALDAPPPPPPPKRSVAPPECVGKILEAVYSAEKEYFSRTKNYSDSLLEIHAASKIGIGCSGWDLPDLRGTYGGSGFTGTMTESASGIKWIINQDKAVILVEKEIKARSTEDESTLKLRK